jgi:REP-associated tyrosine transposase
MKSRRNSLRLENYDYSSLGAYFITICTHKRKNLFGEITENIFYPNELGLIIKKNLDNIPNQNLNIELDEHIIMPNHIHIIIWIVGAIHESPKENPTQNISFKDKRVIRESPLRRKKMLLSKVIGKLKMQTAKEINIHGNSIGSRVWQRGYYDHIIRNQQDLNNEKQYIINNPKNWESDDNNLVNL